MIRVFVETPKGRDSAGFTVPESAGPTTCRWCYAVGVGRRSRYASTLSNRRGSPLIWTGGARLVFLGVEQLAR